MTKRIHIHVNDCIDLQLHIYVLGYYPMGESELVVIWDNHSKIAVRSVLIDCFEADNRNVICDIMDGYGINKKKLDFIVWTHPDLDHSVGYKTIIDKYASEKTCSLLPDGMTNKMFITAPLEVKKSWLSIKRVFNRVKYKILRVSSSNERLYPDVYCPLVFEDMKSDPLNFGIEILTPFAERVFRNQEINKTSKANNISISAIIRFGQCNFYFGGDVENPTINMIERSRLDNVDFIKIPHHGSNSSTKLPEILESKINRDDEVHAIAVTTCFKDTGLPKIELLTKYKKSCSAILRTDNSHVDNYGLWKLVYGVRPFTVIECSKSGDAVKWYG